jgi:hypothetical protein
VRDCSVTPSWVKKSEAKQVRRPCFDKYTVSLGINTVLLGINTVSLGINTVLLGINTVSLGINTVPLPLPRGLYVPIGK